MRKTLNRKQIDAIFEASINQSEACVALYRLAFPEWDELKSIDGWPGIGKEAGLYIIRKFIEFDRKHHPDVFSGGLWMNKGFSTHEGADMGLDPWELCTDNVHHIILTLKERNVCPGHDAAHAEEKSSSDDD